MALVRCAQCGMPNGRGANRYAAPSRLPVGHPDSGIICGSAGCPNTGLVWLLDWEQAQYQKGERIFTLTGRVNHAKLAVQ